jgi:hypothetical protein
MRLRRKKLRLRAMRRSFDLCAVVDRTAAIRPRDILLFATAPQRMHPPAVVPRPLPPDGGRAFPDRRQRIGDGTRRLSRRPARRVALVHRGELCRARFGADWMTWLQRGHGHGHWTLTVDADEFLVYPFCDTRPIRALTDWLEVSGLRAFPAMLLDMYPRGRMDAAPYRAGQDPLELAVVRRGQLHRSRSSRLPEPLDPGRPARAGLLRRRSLPRARAQQDPAGEMGRRYAWASSTHSLLPRGLNRVYDEMGGEKISGCLLHAKFLDTFADKDARRDRPRPALPPGATNTAPMPTASATGRTSGAAGRNATRVGASSTGWA